MRREAVGTRVRAPIWLSFGALVSAAACSTLLSIEDRSLESTTDFSRPDAEAGVRRDADAEAEEPSETSTSDGRTDFVAPVVSTPNVREYSLDVAKITLAWAPATDNVSDGGHLRYNAYRSSSTATKANFTTLAQVKAGTRICTDVVDTNCTYTGSLLVSGEAYMFNVVVSDEAGNESVYQPVGELFGRALRIFYPFNYGGLDVSPNANNAYVNGTTPPVHTTDRFGFATSAYHFSGNSADGQIVISANPIGVSGVTPRTLAFWIKAGTSTATASAAVIAAWGSTTANSQVFGSYFGTTNGSLNFWGYYNDVVTGELVSSGWEFWAFAYDGGTVLRCFKNGVRLSPPALASALSTVDGRIGIGAQPGTITAGSAVPYVGDIDDVRVYSVVLSDSEMTRLYNVTR